MKIFFKILLWIIFVSMFLISYYFFYQEAQKPEDTFICQVVSVHDGDTFSCANGIRVRTWGIDTPEVPPVVKSSVAEKSGGFKSRDYLRKMIKGKTLECKIKGKSYDRTVGQCFLEDQDIAVSLLKKGCAKELKQFSRGHYEDI